MVLLNLYFLKLFEYSFENELFIIDNLCKNLKKYFLRVITDHIYQVNEVIDDVLKRFFGFVFLNKICATQSKQNYIEILLYILRALEFFFKKQLT